MRQKIWTASQVQKRSTFSPGKPGGPGSAFFPGIPSLPGEPCGPSRPWGPGTPWKTMKRCYSAQDQKQKSGHSSNRNNALKQDANKGGIPTIVPWTPLGPRFPVIPAGPCNTQGQKFLLILWNSELIRLMKNYILNSRFHIQLVHHLLEVPGHRQVPSFSKQTR